MRVSEKFYVGRLEEHIQLLIESVGDDAVMFMPGDGRYQPEALKAFFGYDQWARWCVLVEWHWLIVLAEIREIPADDAEKLTPGVLKKMLSSVSTTKQDAEEKITHHDIMALQNLMRSHLAPELQKYLHYGATSYDIIDTAYALQLKSAINYVIMPGILEVDEAWRKLISSSQSIIQAGRTHLQTAVPITVGYSLANLRQRFVDTTNSFVKATTELNGKFSGAVGTGSAQVALLKCDDAESLLLRNLGLEQPLISSQIVPPEKRANCYFQMLLLSGVLANLGEDVRILQSSQYGELVSPSSSSSTMAHKTANPIIAENLKGMHSSVKAEFSKVISTPALISNLQRDLTGSSIARSFSATAVYFYQMVLNAKKLLSNIEINEQKCQENFESAKYLVMAELLHLGLQKQGVEYSHEILNKKIVPLAVEKNCDLVDAMEKYLADTPKDYQTANAWMKIDDDIKTLLKHPEKYLGWTEERIHQSLKRRIDWK